MSEYYIYINKVKAGPYKLEELSYKPLTPETLVWCEGFVDWRQAKDVPELTDMLSKIPPEPKITPNQPMPKTWFLESLLVTIFCCLPFGIIGIIESNNVESMYRSGRYELAVYYSQKAKKWALWGFFSAAVLFGLYLIVMVMIIAAGI